MYYCAADTNAYFVSDKSFRNRSIFALIQYLLTSPGNSSNRKLISLGVIPIVQSVYAAEVYLLPIPFIINNLNLTDI